MYHLQCISLSETCYGKNAEAAENSHIIQLVSVFQHSVTGTPKLHMQHTKLLQSMMASTVRVCAISAF
jgi:hypothetical protein